MKWFEDQLKIRLQNDEDDFTGAFRDLSSVVMGDEAANAGMSSPRQKIHNAIQMILKFFGTDIVQAPEGITDNEEYINYFLKPSGIMKRRVELNGKWWTDAYGPMLGKSNGGDVVAIIPTTKGYCYYNYETHKKTTVTASTAKNLETSAYCFYKPFPCREITVVDLVKYIFSTITVNDIFLYLTIMAITTIMGMIIPRLSLLLYSIIIPEGNISHLPPVGVLMLSFAISAQLLMLSREIIMNQLTFKLNNTVEPAVMMRTLNLPAGFFKKYASGELAQKVSLVPDICNSIFSVITGTLITSLFSLVYFVQIGRIAPSLLPSSFLIIGATLAVNIIVTVISIKIQRKALNASAELSGLTYSILSGIQKIKITNSEKRIFSRWAAKYKAASNFIYNPPSILKYSSLISAIISTGGLALIYITAITAQISVGEYMAYNASFGMVSASILSLGSLTTFYASLKPMLDIVEPMLKECPEISGGKTVVTEISGGVEVSNLSFRYDENGPYILDGINLKVRSGQYVAIVGKTGCGKSTLIRLLLGFEKTARGAIYYNGKNITSLDLPSLRRKIGTVMQSGKLFKGDILSNIIISAPHLTLDDAWEAARIAGIDKDIAEMPMGMHTVITEGSGGISGGQKQRLMIARAVAPKPKILILDESTSALDNITQKHVADSLAELKCTRIVIAHRLSTIKECDMIYVLDKGKIIEEGTFDELYEKEGFFHELVNRQMIGGQEK